MSQALYRRYRPETFADVIGQEHVTQPLQQALRTGRVNHAYLFSGPRGCGKTTSARILARCLNCEGGPTDTPCGTCDSCVALARGGAGTVDVIEIDAASHGGVDDARELRERASYGPAQSRYKIYIIDEAHMVTPQGFNALLKIVEEPPEHVKFVFATTEPEKVIGTIRSRTHHYPFRLVPPAQLQDYLGALCGSEGVQVESGVLSFVVRAGGGSVRDSLSVLDQLIAGSGSQGLTYEGAAALLGFTDAELLDATVTAIGHGDAADAFAQVDRVIETGLDPRRFVEDLLERLRDLIICAAIPDGAGAVLRTVPSDQLERMHVQAGFFGAGGLSRAADVVNSGLTEMTGTTSPRLQLELIIARLLLPGAAGAQGYAARLDRIERRLDTWGREGAREGSGGPPHAPAAEALPGRTLPRQESPSQPPTRHAPPSDTSPPVPSPPNTSPPPDTSPSDTGPSPAAGPGLTSSTATGQPVADGVDQASQSPAPPTPTPATAAASTSAPAPTPAPSQSPTAGRDQAAIVRAWPDILDWLSRNKRVTWTLVSASAQPLTFDGSRLVLAIETAGLAETFRRGAHPNFVQEALMEVLGIDARVEGVASQTAPDAVRSGPGAPATGPITSPWATSAPPESRAPVSAPDVASDGSASETSRRAPRLSGSASPQSDQQSAPSPSRPGAKQPTSSAPGAGSAVPDVMPTRSTPATPTAPATPGPGGADWSSAPPPASSAPSWATEDADPIDSAPVQPSPVQPRPVQRTTMGAAAAETAPIDTPGTPPSERERLASVVPIRREDRRTEASPAGGAPGEAVPQQDVIDDPDAISDDDEDIETSGEIGQAVVERLLGGTVISEDDEEG